ncbi:MAG: bifunctional phosphoribosyl-AMP cyclohydrolase/phosphoribosyl-ATP diphosphatase HisIE [Lachnospiraceae bacterium]|nr:bifunctional phosphoribosyl-AMP cyclohydrolase/phosphoribosyl-ATP diphosphatase HisIE [Lachnospiraceae bacterium]
MKIEQKDIIVTLFLKDGILVKGFQDHTPAGKIDDLIRSYNDNGVDKIILYDLSDDDAEHEKNIQAIKSITLISELPVYAGGNINSLDDIRKILYSGCIKVVLNSLKSQTAMFAREGAQRFGKERMALSVFSVDVFFKQKDSIEEYISELIVLDEHLASTMSDVTDMPYSILMESITQDTICDVLTAGENIKGISCPAFCDHSELIPELKQYLKEKGVSTNHLTATMEWSDFKINEEGLIPVVTQDYQTNEVLMLAYMDQDAYQNTLETGKMTYYSRSRKELWMKGETSGHYQYVKSLMVDCDRDSILAKVSQIGAACHTGNHSCFYTDLATDEYLQRNLFEVLDNTYNTILERKDNPKNGSYTSYMFGKGLEEIGKKLGEETLDLIFASISPDRENIKFQAADLVYHLMVLMAEVDIDWEDVLEELLVR